MPRAVVVGVDGQDGRLLYDSLAADGYGIAGIGRNRMRSTDLDIASPPDIFNPSAVVDFVQSYKPDEIYYLAAFHHSSEDAIASTPITHLQASYQVHVAGYLNFLEAVRISQLTTRIFYAASAHVFGWPQTTPQTESTPFDPQCAYGITKAQGVFIGRWHRRDFGMKISNGILFNHESSYRRRGFVSRKIIEAAKQAALDPNYVVELGDLTSAIDWGYAPDYVRAMRRIQKLDDSDDFIVATGEQHTVEEFLELAFRAAGVQDWTRHVRVKPDLLTKRARQLVGDATKLRTATGWRPTVSFKQMVELLVSQTSLEPCE